MLKYSDVLESYAEEIRLISTTQVNWQSSNTGLIENLTMLVWFMEKFAGFTRMYSLIRHAKSWLNVSHTMNRRTR